MNITFHFLSSASEQNLKVKLCDSHFQHSETPFDFLLTHIGVGRGGRGRRRGVGGGTMHINETSRTIGAITQQYLYGRG